MESLEQSLLHHCIMKLKRVTQSCYKINLNLSSYQLRMTPDNRQPQGNTEVNWDPVEILDLKGFKEAVVSDGIHSPFFEADAKFMGN